MITFDIASSQTSSSGGAGVIVEPAVTVYNLEVKADVVADIANIAEFGKTSDTTQASRGFQSLLSFPVSCFPVS